MEEWRPAEGYPYEVSSDGRVRRLGSGRGVKPGRILKSTLINSGYLIVVLSRENRGTTRLLHRLVAAVFIGPCPAGFEVNHKNLKKADNRAANLEYVTRSENLLHRARAGIGRGHRNGMAKLTEADVRQIRQRYRQGGRPGYKALGVEYGVSWEAIRNIIKGRVWKWVAE